MGSLIAGVDEAGRGSLLGPLVIACVIVREEHLERLKSIGVRDSKVLTRRKRALLYREIKNIADNVAIKRIKPKEIDERSCSLNMLELYAIASILKRVRADEIYIDSFDVNPRRLESRLARMLGYYAMVHANHKADDNYLVVSAASIIAKVERDNAIDRLRMYGEIGSGYPSDIRTLNFVIDWIKEHNRYPEFARCSWKTMQRILHTLQLP